MPNAVSLAATLVFAVLMAVRPALAVDVEDQPVAESNPEYRAAKKAVKAEQYADAIILLERVVAALPGNADALNNLGFSNRKMGRFEAALAWYEKALAVNPDHRGANEYLGELYLQMGDLEKAAEQLAKLDILCLFGCEEYDDLKEAIAAYKPKS